MQYWVQALTGGSDVWRCPLRTACKLSLYLHPWAHLVRMENRSSAVVGGQWELAVLLLACWSACTNDAGSPTVFKNGEALFSCPECDRLSPYASHEEGSGVVHCRSDVCRGTSEPFPVLQVIPKSTFEKACNAARRVAGGVRGYPLFFGLKTRLQLPVLHCTGNLSKMVLLFTLACLPTEVCAVAKRNILAITSKGKVESLYLREYREMVASAVACPSVLSQELDPVFFIILQLVQLINAGWRSSLTDEVGTERAASAATTRLASSILGPLFHEVKPLDPETKDSKVVNLYLHAPIAHLHHQVGDNRSDVAFVSDDNMEGHVRGVGRFLYNNGSNAPQAALFSDLVGMKAATLNFSTPRSHPSSLIYTKYVRVCNCWASLGADGPADYAALRSLSRDEANLTVVSDAGEDFLLVELPLHERVEANGLRRRDSEGKPLLGKKESVRRGLRTAQHTIVACFCGRLTGTSSSVMELLRQKQAAAAAARAVASRGAAEGGPHATTRGALARLASEASLDCQGESDAGSAGDGALESSADGLTETEGDVGSGATQRQQKRHTAAGIASTMSGVLPPRSLLSRVFDDAAVYATLYGDATASQPVCSLPDMVASVRKHISVMELFLLRTRTPSFAEWALSAAVDRREMVLAAKSVLSRLLSVRNSLLPADALVAIV